MKKQIQPLQELLASFSIAIANAKSYHWLITGSNFFILHAKFEELYESMSEYTDTTAERILALGESPVVGYSNYLQISKIKETTRDISVNDKKVIEEILETFKVLIIQGNEVKENAISEKDDETDNKIEEIIYELQKLSWQYSVYLK